MIEFEDGKMVEFDELREEVVTMEFYIQEMEIQVRTERREKKDKCKTQNSRKYNCRIEVILV